MIFELYYRMQNVPADCLFFNNLFQLSFNKFDNFVILMDCFIYFFKQFIKIKNITSLYDFNTYEE